MKRRTLIAALALAAGAALGACGGSSGGGASSAAPASQPSSGTSETAPAASGPATTAPAATGPTGGTTAPSGETQPGGAGDEQPVLVPAKFAMRSGRLDPSTIRVPAFLRVGITVTSTDRQDHTLRIAGHEIAVPAMGRGSATIDGLRAGRYPITEPDGTTVGTLEVGGEPGP